MIEPVRRALAALLPVALLALGTVVVLAPPARADLEDFASYQPESRCSPRPKPGAVYLSTWLVKHYGGSRGRIGASCTPSVSEHQEGRAVDWTNDATTKAARKRVAAFMDDVFGPDHRDRPAALARRMGIMYVIWDDHIYSAWDGFEPRKYLSSSCPKIKKCSKTLRHRDHVHVSLSRSAARGRTSWFAGRLP